MSPDLAIDLVRDAVLMAVVIGAPVLGVVFAVSFLIALLQTMTSLQDPTIAIVPRLLVGGIALLCLLPWMVERLTDFSTGLLRGSSWSP